jgi:hypothetical protein
MSSEFMGSGLGWLAPYGVLFVFYVLFFCLVFCGTPPYEVLRSVFRGCDVTFSVLRLLETESVALATSRVQETLRALFRWVTH